MNIYLIAILDMETNNIPKKGIECITKRYAISIIYDILSE